MSIQSIKELPIEGKKVFIRVDFNVPLTRDGKVADTTRIDAALPTIRFALEKGVRVILASHLGRPKGKVDMKFSMEPVGMVLAEKLDMEIKLADSAVGDGPFKLASELRDGEVLLLENLRFHPGETSNDESFARALASMADVYVNDAFGTSHRAHASTAGMVPFVEEAGAGFLLEKEVNFFEKLLSSPDKPFVAILGGAKVSDKVGVIRKLMDLVDKIIIGGAMANTFLSAQGFKTGQSRVEEDKISLCKELLQNAKARNIDILLPKDVVIAASLDATETEIVGISEGVDPDKMALDIGPETVEMFLDALTDARTIFWNGPMGVFENPVLAVGTMNLAQGVAKSKGMTVIGGGDSVSAINKAGLADKISHISTGGGASLEMMEGLLLPGLQALAR
ncbi:MAG: phosphoglycerate kinase [Deltaproteobacteria bacterium]|nr:phosphoglycerate kinase [Deltaproteobacteria bacterium]